MAHSDNEKIRVWKERAVIDYVSPFMNLWLCLNAWMNNEYPKLSGDRNKLNSLKANPSPLLDRFKELMDAPDTKATLAPDINATLFRSYFAELHRALINADIRYHQFPDKIVRFDCCLIDQTTTPRNFESILVQPGEITANVLSESGDIEQEVIKLDDDVWVEGDTERLFKAYMESIYQIRCNLFHGDLVPDTESRQVIRLLYLTLILIMEEIG
ncbi:hypothetical protein C6503_03375 [Candidatus Poribacteria bacterium]|nr:MAG: hypothetical protein C6503_03375 [Candidatus Poribacteria bacterium]